MDCVHESDGKALVDVEVVPNSSESGVTGFNEWRKRLEVKVKSVAQKGRANEEVVEVLSEFFGVEVRIVKGETSRQKTLEVGLSAEQVERKLSTCC